MRIGFLTSEYRTERQTEGGVATYLATLSELLIAAGHEPTVFLLGRENRRFTVRGVPIIEVRTPWVPYWMLPGPLWVLRDFARQWRAANRMARAFRREHRRRPFDVVQTANWRALGVRLALSHRIPFVVQISSYLPLLRRGEGIVPFVQERLTDFLDRLQMRHAQKVFGPSNLHIRALREQEGIDGAVIRIPVHLSGCEEDSRVYETELAGVRYFLYFGKLNRLKGAEDMAAALPRVLDADRTVHAVFLGADTPAPWGGTWGHYILKQVGSHVARVHLLGAHPRAASLPILRHAQFVVIPSRVDNYPNACLEAQALGKIVVGTDGSSLEEMIQHGRTGFLSKPACPDSLAEALIQTLKLSEERRKEMEAAVRVLAAERDPMKDVQAHLRLYQEAIEIFHRNRRRYSFR
ncbi:MAG: glycosyltransferase family 4 protein [Kiritimatiellia bacterium]